MRFENYKRYVIIYQKLIGYHRYTDPELIDTDDKSEFDDMLNMTKESYEHVLAVDTNKWYVSYNTLVIEKDNDSQYNNWIALERYFGDGKTVEDFMDMDKYRQIQLQSVNNPLYNFQEHQYLWKASWKYQAYLKNTWNTRKKKKKNLPKLQVYDSSFMNQDEIDGLKQAEKEKINTILNKSGW